MANPTIRLGRDGMGEGATEEDYDSYVDLVCERIDAMCGFTVDVEVPRASEVQGTTVRAYKDEQARTINEALVELWDAWCSGDRAQEVL